MEARHLDDDALQSLLDGDSGLEGAREARAHLDDCPACRENLEAYRTLFDALADESALPPTPPDLAEGVRKVLRGEANVRRARFRGLLKALAVGAAAAVLFAAAAGLDLESRTLDLFHALSERAPAPPLPDFEGASGVERRLEWTLDAAGARLAEVIRKGRGAVRLGAGTLPVLAAGIALLAALQGLALWKLRSRPNRG